MDRGKVPQCPETETKFKVVELTKWRDQCRVNGLTDPEATADTKRKAFTRAKDRLLDRDCIRAWDQFVWKVTDDD